MGHQRITEVCDSTERLEKVKSLRLISINPPISIGTKYEAGILRFADIVEMNL
jgi:hypothetical protein